MIWWLGLFGIVYFLGYLCGPPRSNIRTKKPSTPRPPPPRAQSAGPTMTVHRFIWRR